MQLKNDIIADNAVKIDAQNKKRKKLLEKRKMSKKLNGKLQLLAKIGTENMKKALKGKKNYVQIEQLQSKKNSSQNRIKHTQIRTYIFLRLASFRAPHISNHILWNE